MGSYSRDNLYIVTLNFYKGITGLNHLKTLVNQKRKTYWILRVWYTEKCTSPHEQMPVARCFKNISLELVGWKDIWLFNVVTDFSLFAKGNHNDKSSVAEFNLVFHVMKSETQTFLWELQWGPDHSLKDSRLTLARAWRWCRSVLMQCLQRGEESDS